jgi:hypothetical protein
VRDFNETDISKMINGKLPLFGTFEFVNVFGEYCCKYFCVTAEADGSFQSCAQHALISFPLCPSGPEFKNICAD